MNVAANPKFAPQSLNRYQQSASIASGPRSQVTAEATPNSLESLVSVPARPNFGATGVSRRPNGLASFLGVNQ